MCLMTHPLKRHAIKIYADIANGYEFIPQLSATYEIWY